MEKETNTQAQNDLVTPEDWTEEAFPEAHKPDSDSGLETKEEEAIPADVPDLGIPKQTETGEIDPNEAKRFQYWQSRADKLKNENEALRAQMQAPVQAQEEAPQEEPKREFPPPPERPRKPRLYTREEAMTDPNSISAQYDDALDNWRDRMDKYNNLYAQYNVALAEERMDAIEGRQQAVEQEKVQRAERQQAMGELSEYVQATYGLTPDETYDFIDTMSQPESLSIGNLVELYKMKGKQVINNVPTQVGTEVGNNEFASEPSELFKQTKRAQQVPSPMGVMSGQAETKSNTDSIMDEMIETYNKKNPF